MEARFFKINCCPQIRGEKLHGQQGADQDPKMGPESHQVQPEMTDIKPSEHNRSTEYEEDDPVTKAIEKTGCLEFHYAVQECMGENRDWRVCQGPVQTFAKCMNEYYEAELKRKK